MKEKKSTQRESEFASPAAQEQYAAPNIEVTDIELGQNIFASGGAPDMPGEPW